MTHRRAVLTMIAVTLMWSIAGVVTRQLESTHSFEVTLWRSAFNAAALVLLLSAQRGPATLWRDLPAAAACWLSGLCWCVMYTAFMVALTLTTVANVLVTMATAPLFTALGARLVLGHRLALRTWAAIGAAGAGIAWMYGGQVSAGDTRQLAGTAVALAVPVAAAVNWTLLQSQRTRPGSDMLPAVLIGALLSALLTLPFATPFAASTADLGWLGLLGVVQLAVPCLLAVSAARVLSAPEASLLSLLEVVFGVAWAWLGTQESPSAAVLGGGLLVLGALAADAAASMRRA